MTIAASPAVDGDYEGIVDLLRRAALPVDGLCEHLGNAVVARDSSGLVAAAALEIYGDAALLRSVVVRTDRQGTGAGRTIVDAALQLARARHVVAAYLLTTSATAFFEHLGFRTIARDAVPPRVQTSVEFAGACPTSATAMRLTIS